MNTAAQTIPNRSCPAERANSATLFQGLHAPLTLIVSLALLASASISHASTPYNGTPIDIPGTIEAEDYDLGGEGDAYHDTSAGNTGGGYRTSEDVDIETCSEGGYNVGWTVAGEWLKYTVNVVSNGNYTITTRVATEVSTGAFHIEVDGVDVTGSIPVPNTGNWQVWHSVTSVVALSAGQQVVRLVIADGDININRFDITLNGPAPAAPTGLQVDSSGANTVSLSWTASATGSPTSYNVKRATSGGGTYSTIGTVTAPTVTFTDFVTGGATYYYVVSGVNGNGEGADSSPPVSATPTLGVPDAPTGLAANPGDNQVALNWTAPAVGSPTSYNVARSILSEGPYTNIIGTTTAPTTSYTDTTAVNGTTYYYVVSAVNATGEGANSTEVNATPAVFTGIYEPFDYAPGNLVSGTAATADGFGTWTCGIDGVVYAGLTYPGLPVANNALQSPAGSRQFVSLDSPISSGTKWISFLYYVPGNMGEVQNGVYFPNGSTNCLWFGFGLSPVSGTDGYLGLGSMPTAGTSPQSATQLTLLDVGTYGTTYLVAMEIQFDTSGNNDTVTVYLNPVTNQATPGVPAAGTHSTFDVGTLSGVGLNVVAAGWVGLDEIRIADTYADVVDAVVTPPDTPTGLGATAGSNSVSLSWTAAGGSPTGYRVKRASVPGGPYTNIIGTTTAPTVSYNDSVLGGQTYYYVVSAVNGAGESTDSLEVAATPTLAAPATPTGLTAIPGNAQVDLSWTASPFATSYTVKRATVLEGPYTLIGNTTAPIVAYPDSSGLTNGLTYHYVVSATGAGGTSADSAAVSATPDGPRPLVATVARGTGIRWFASNGVTYQVQWASEWLGTNTVWNNLGGSMTGTGTTNTVFDPAGPAHNVHRVLSIQ